MTEFCGVIGAIPQITSHKSRLSKITIRKMTALHQPAYSVQGLDRYVQYQMLSW